MTQTITATFERGVIRPKQRPRLREHAKLTLIIQPSDPVSRTRGAIRVPAREAKILIYDDSLLDF